MAILSDRQIRELANSGGIENFQEHLVRKVDDMRMISYGVSSFGYDVRLADTELKCFVNKPVFIGTAEQAEKVIEDVLNEVNSLDRVLSRNTILNSAAAQMKYPHLFLNEIDPKNFDPRCLVDMEVLEDAQGKYVLIPGHSYILGHTIEYFNLPRDVLLACMGKSTYARTAISVNVTPIEPGFKGNVVIETFNHCGLPVRVYLNEGISQFLFFKGSEECEVSYADRSGKYMHQKSTQLPLA